MGSLLIRQQNCIKITSTYFRPKIHLNNLRVGQSSTEMFLNVGF